MRPESWFCCLLIVAAGAWWGIWMARGPRREEERLRAEVARTDLSDVQALQAGESRYERLIGRHYGSPESIADGGRRRMMAGDPTAALYFYQKSIDLLHTHYVVHEMRDRKPADRDTVITDGYLGVLHHVLERHPAAPVAPSVHEVTGRLRTISTACRNRGISGHRYLSALEQLGRMTPNIYVDDVFW